MQSSDFLTALWGSDPTAPILVWTLPDGRSHWFPKPEEADRDWGDRNVFTCVSLPPPDQQLVSKKKFLAEESSAIAGLWADVDYTHDVHTKPGLPTQEHALKTLLQSVEQPTILVRSGHGFHGWWLFDQPWYFVNKAEREAAERLVQWWQLQLKIELQASIDSTADLARVLRLPGTYNRKSDTPELVTADFVGERHKKEWWLGKVPESFLSSADRAGHQNVKASNPDASRIILRADGAPDTDQLAALIDAIPDIQSALDHTKKLEDMSASGYDLSLMSLAVQAGWDDQKLVDLCLFHRRQHNEDLKLKHPSYWERTIAAARRSHVPSVAEIATSELESLMGLGIKRVIKLIDPQSPDWSKYRIFANDRWLELIDVDELIKQQKFLKVIAEQLGKIIVLPKGVAWIEFVNRLLSVTEEINPGHPDYPRTQGEVGETLEWVSAFLKDRTVMPDPSEPDRLNVPFELEGQVYFHSHDFRRWLKLKREENVTSQRIGTRLRNAGFEPKHIGKTRRRTWTRNDDEE